jgi:glycosyltransferase involved in cell wall biosynthesis
MDFSVVIPSRNRPVLLREALQSVLAQTHPVVEVVVVNDGSDGDNEAAYAQLAQEFEPRVRFVNLEHTLRGHGQSYAINRGVEAAQGQYVCFLDDDDYWTDNEHLARAWRALSATDADVYYTNQAAYLGEERVPGPIWLEGLDEIIARHDAPDENGVYSATLADMMAAHGFGHLNTSVVRRSLYLDIGGMDENIRYECDWDFFLRTIDAAGGILFYPGITSHHNAPDPTKTVNMSTAVNMLQKMLFRSYVLDKAALFSKSAEIVAKAKRHKIYTLKKITELLSEEGNYQRAFYYAKQARGTSWDITWTLYSLYLGLRSLTSKT